MATGTYGQKPVWDPTRPRIGPGRAVVAWVLVTASLLIAASIVRGADVKNFRGAFLGCGGDRGPQRDPAAADRGAAPAGAT